MDWVVAMIYMLGLVYWIFLAGYGCWTARRRRGRISSAVERMLDSVPDVPYLPLPDQEEASTGGEDGPLSSSASASASACVICIAEYDRGEGRFLLPSCGHAFHRGCIAEWLLHGKTTCPICRAAAIVVGPPEGEEKVDAVSTAQDMV